MESLPDHLFGRGALRDLVLSESIQIYRVVTTPRRRRAAFPNPLHAIRRPETVRFVRRDRKGFLESLDDAGC
jgi:hypothetical protein